MKKTISLLQEGFHTAFIDYRKNSELSCRPQFISNDYKTGRKVIASIEEELSHCDEFFISVAFITENGIESLLQTLSELEKNKIPGKILTTNYLNFSEPKALEKLNNFENIEVRMYYVDGNGPGFHTKGYMFREEEVYKFIIGSSNLTARALSVNKEWNTKIIATEQGEYAREIRIEFNKLWDDAKPLKEWIETYTRVYEEQRRISKLSNPVLLDDYKLEPNEMQVSFIDNLNELLKNDAKRALLISATGTGKTYASAFALRDIKAHKILFLVHREQIAKQALDSYRRVFGQTKSYGVLSGTSKDIDKDLIFATVQTMAKDEILSKFDRDEFDVIVVDEVHRAGAAMHQKVMDYFNPKLYLGMTASPERPDGFDIFQLFDHNIAYEIRLQQALEADMLCPFHYFGITDIEIDGEVKKGKDTRVFKDIVSNRRVDYIIEKAEYFGYSGERVKGLVFCSRKDEAKELSRKFVERGYAAVDLSGEDRQSVREDTIDRLVNDNREDKIDYIFTVDIFNEGVDIPEINQIIMLRPTTSPIVFVQQLGRGLRKHEDKEFVVILDFIGNYDNNFLIPIALSGDRSYNKDTIRRYISSSTRVIPGCSSIHFDEISRKRIYDSIDSARTNDSKLLKEAYNNLKYRIGHIPSINDFDKYGSIDVTKIFDNNTYGSYYRFLKKVEPEYNVELTDGEEKTIAYISKKYAKGKRVHELEVLHLLLNGASDIKKEFVESMEKTYGIKLTKQEFESVICNLNLEFAKESERKTAGVPIVSEKDNKVICSKEFAEMLKNNQFKKMANELVEFGIMRYIDNYSDRYKGTNLQLYQKYTYEDVCRLLNWEKNMNALNIGGYFYDVNTKTLPVFINYNKSSDAIAYEDRFNTSKELTALSKHPRKINSTDADHFYKREPADKDNKILLFVRKNKDDNEAKEFYFLGEINATGEPNPIIMTDTNDDAFEISYVLEDAVREDIFEYIIGA